MKQPSFWSLVLADITDPDYTHVCIDVLPAHATADPAAWASSEAASRNDMGDLPWKIAHVR